MLLSVFGRPIWDAIGNMHSSKSALGLACFPTHHRQNGMGEKNTGSTVRRPAFKHKFRHWLGSLSLFIFLFLKSYKMKYNKTKLNFLSLWGLIYIFISVRVRSQEHSVFIPYCSHSIPIEGSQPWSCSRSL